MRKKRQTPLEKYVMNYLKEQQKLFKAYTIKPKRIAKGKRKDFTNNTKKVILAYQEYRCKDCYSYLEYPEFDHYDGDRTNNSVYNCQALCPNCHARKSRLR